MILAMQRPISERHLCTTMSDFSAMSEFGVISSGVSATQCLICDAMSDFAVVNMLQFKRVLLSHANARFCETRRKMNKRDFLGLS